MTPLTNQKLVEASEALRDYLLSSDITNIPDDVWNPFREAIKEASAAETEFPPGSGMDRGSWFTLEYTLEAQNKNGYYSHMIAACRQIAEGLSE